MTDGKRLDRRNVHRGHIVDLSVDTVRLPNGNVREMEVIHHPGAAAIVAVDAQRAVLLVRQYRYAIGGWLLEVPAGKLDGGETPEACAAREIEEETGFRAGCFEPLGWIWTTPGFTDEKIWIYLATDLTATRTAHQPDEIISVERIPLEDAVERARRGEIHDAKSVCALFRASARLRP